MSRNDLSAVTAAKEASAEVEATAVAVVAVTAVAVAVAVVAVAVAVDSKGEDVAIRKSEVALDFQ